MLLSKNMLSFSIFGWKLQSSHVCQKTVCKWFWKWCTSVSLMWYGGGGTFMWPVSLVPMLFSCSNDAWQHLTNNKAGTRDLLSSIQTNSVPLNLLFIGYQRLFYCWETRSTVAGIWSWPLHLVLSWRWSYTCIPHMPWWHAQGQLCV